MYIWHKCTSVFTYTRKKWELRRDSGKKLAVSQGTKVLKRVAKVLIVHGRANEVQNLIENRAVWLQDRRGVPPHKLG
jgi:hypothetical protein